MDIQDKVRDQLLTWYDQSTISEHMSLDELALKISICKSTLANFMYHDKRLHARSLCKVRSFLKSL